LGKSTRPRRVESPRVRVRTKAVPRLVSPERSGEEKFNDYNVCGDRRTQAL
jgi:hypothetical protein